MIVGPWIHGVGAVGKERTGDLDFGPEAAVDYDDLILRWMDHYLRESTTAPAEIRIHHDAGYPSRLVLPVIPR